VVGGAIEVIERVALEAELGLEAALQTLVERLASEGDRERCALGDAHGHVAVDGAECIDQLRPHVRRPGVELLGIRVHLCSSVV
jgi:hypothetical protein